MGEMVARAGTSSARRWPRSISARSSRSTAGPRSRLPAPRERDRRSRVPLGHPFARIWMHNGMLRFAGEEMHKSAGNDVSLAGRARSLGSRDGAPVLPVRPLAEAARLLGDDDDRGRAHKRRRFRKRLREPDRARSGDLGSLREQRSTTTSTPRRARQSSTSGRDQGSRGASARAGRLRSRLAGRTQDAPPRTSIQLAEARVVARAAREFAEADRLRDEIGHAGWEVRDAGDGYDLVPRS